MTKHSSGRPSFLVGLSLLLFPFVAVAYAQGPAERGKALYIQKCAPCHGERGTGKGPDAASLPTKPTDFTRKTFWQGDAGKRMMSALGMGETKMPPIQMKPDELKDILDYMTRAFGPGQ